MKLTTKLAALAAGLAFASAAPAADPVKVAIGQKGLWDTLPTVVGVEKGLFRKEGLDVDITWTRGGAETLQAVLTRSADFAMTNGILGVLAAYAKGAPVRIVSAQMTGAPDLFWYVKANSPIRSMADMAGKTAGYSRPGSSTNLVLLGLVQKANVDAKLVPAGGIPATRTQVMSGQIDAGWSVPPFNLDLLKKGEIRIIAHGNDVPGIAEQTVRVNVVNADVLKSDRSKVERFMRGYVASIAFMYEHEDEALKIFATMNKIDTGLARDAVQFYPRESLQPFEIKGLDESMKQAVEYKKLAKPLTQAQVDDLVQIVVKARR